jgi:hypothetical protein
MTQLMARSSWLMANEQEQQRGNGMEYAEMFTLLVLCFLLL